MNLIETKLFKKHFITTAAVLPLLRPDWSADKAWNMASVHYEMIDPSIKLMVISDEPVYEAGAIAEISPQDVDGQSPEFSARYNAIRLGVSINPEQYIGARVMPNLDSINN